MYHADLNGQSVSWNTALTSSGGSLTVDYSSSAGSLTFSNVSTYSRATTITGGTVIISSDNNIGSGGGLNLNVGTLAVTAGFSTPRTVAVNANSSIDVASAQTLSLTTALNGSGALTKANTGTLILNGPGIFGGTTRITGGTVNLNAAGVQLSAVVLSGSNSIVTGTGSILRGVSGATVGAISFLSGGGVVWPGQGLSGGHLSVSGSEVMNAASAVFSNNGKLAVILNPNAGGTMLGQTLAVTGAVSVDSTSKLSVGYAALNGTNSNAFTVLSIGSGARRRSHSIS